MLTMRFTILQLLDRTLLYLLSGRGRVRVIASYDVATTSALRTVRDMITFGLISFYFLNKMSPQVHVKNYETVSKFVKVMQRKL